MRILILLLAVALVTPADARSPSKTHIERATKFCQVAAAFGFKCKQ